MKPAGAFSSQPAEARGSCGVGALCLAVPARQQGYQGHFLLPVMRRWRVPSLASGSSARSPPLAAAGAAGDRRRRRRRCRTRSPGSRKLRSLAPSVPPLKTPKKNLARYRTLSELQCRWWIENSQGCSQTAQLYLSPALVSLQNDFGEVLCPE